MSWVRAGLTGTHRVLGVGIALLVMLWFGSGAVLLFVPYPSLTVRRSDSDGWHHSSGMIAVCRLIRCGVRLD